MVEFLKTLAIACIPAIITGIVTYIVARKNAASQISIIKEHNSDKQKNFYPDYIIGVNDEVWIVETKGGFDRSGNSQDIDIFTPKKFAVLKDYLDRYRLKGGIVRYDEKSEELCICMDNYSEDINSDSWVVLSDILK